MYCFLYVKERETAVKAVKVTNMAEVVVKKKKNDVNKFHFCGVMISKGSNSAVTRTINMRMATRHNNRLYVNNPVVLVFDQKLQDKVEKIPLRVPVVVDGYISSKKQDKNAEKHGTFEYPLQTFVLTDIHLAADDEKDNKNEIDLIGSIEKAYVGKGKVIHFIVVAFREGHYMKRIKVDLFPKDDMDYQQLIELMIAGTRVHVTGHCSTTSQDTEHGSRHTEFIVVDSIEKA